ncbi:MAG: hypothetical protein A2X46_05140 [Lentisphaerae bacterium GWF2_57_35]|nr:MAG: hypothetical protein A2X46_05140 [Lentisphaerae bacterium GWF2_57_35]
MIRVAYFCEPQVGGTFRFFTRTRALFREQDIDFVCMPPMDGRKLRPHPLAREQGVQLLNLASKPAEATRQIIEELELQRIQAIMILPGCDSLSTNLPCYLPPNIRCLARLPLMTEGVYRPVRILAPWIDRMVAVSPRIKDDLLDREVPMEKINMIPNGIALSLLKSSSALRMQDSVFRLLYVGRLEEMQKNVLLLPKILCGALNRGLMADLVVVGDGPDRKRLEYAFHQAGLDDRVHFRGAIPPDDMPEYYQHAHCLIFPSRYEGSPNAMLEAMSEGCVPVATHIRGLTDHIIEDGTSGVLVPMGAAEAFSKAVYNLGLDRQHWGKMSELAQQRIYKNFSLKSTTSAYADVIREVFQSPDKRAERLSLDRYTPPCSLHAGWRALIPPAIKGAIRQWLEKHSRSI